jgi:hypothetical protein
MGKLYIQTWFLLHYYLVPTKVHSPGRRVLIFTYCLLDLGKHTEDI